MSDIMLLSVDQNKSSRSKKVIENTFDILISRWGIFSTHINGSVEKFEKCVKSAIVLNNCPCQADYFSIIATRFF